MSLTEAKMTEEVWYACVSHALSTEAEEIMGLLLGDIETSSNGTVTAYIWEASPQIRSDRRKDRVETSPEQLAAAASQADHRMTQETGRLTRVIGWYHSHPRITVHPSHVDLRTQATYQLLDSGFIGLIFSCFSEHAEKIGRIQVIAFQSLDGKQRNVSGQFNISSVVDLDSPSSRNLISARKGSLIEAPDQDTGDSSVSKGMVSEIEQLFKLADVNSLNKDKGSCSTDVSPSHMSDEDSELSAGMREAIYRSKLEVSDAQFVCKGIPLQIMPSMLLFKRENPLSAFAQLQRVIFEEEQAAYKQAIIQSTRDGKTHPLSVIHHKSTYTASMCKLIECCLSPAMNALQNQLDENEMLLIKLAEEGKLLEAELAAGSSDSLPGPPLPKFAKAEVGGVEIKVSHQQPEDDSAGKPSKEIKVYRCRSKGSRRV